jgi:hypothetical protein
VMQDGKRHPDRDVREDPAHLTNARSLRS